MPNVLEWGPPVGETRILLTAFWRAPKKVVRFVSSFGWIWKRIAQTQSSLKWCNVAPSFLGNFQNFIYCISSFAVAVPGCASICWSRSTGLKFKLTSSSLSWQFVLKTNSGYPIELPLKSKWDPIPQRHHKILGCTGNLSSADHGISGDPCVGSPPWSCGKDQSLPLGRCASAFCPIQTHLIWTCGLR